MIKNSEQIVEWFRQNRRRMTRNGTWFQGHEPGTMPPSAFEAASLRVLIVRLSPYQEVASGLTHAYLWQMAAAVAGCYVDMAFMPPERDEKLMRESGIPLLTGTTSKKPAAAFDVIAFSNSVLQELINLPAMMHWSDIPLSRQERERQAAPLILLGGSNSYTLSVLHGAIETCDGNGLIDAVLVGDGERAFTAMLEIIRDQHGAVPRQLLLKELQKQIPGCYVPADYQQVFNDDSRLVAIKAADGAPMPVKTSKTACLTGSETFTGGPVMYFDSNSAHVMLSAGCPSFCSFCKESWEQKPYRETDADRVVAAARQIKAEMGVSELSLMTFNANTCSHIFSLVEQLGSMFDRVAIKSQRFDAVVNSPELLDLQFDAGKRTYTCAMEGISERLRGLLQKNLTESVIMAGIDLLLQRDMRQMKVFLILTGYENQQDIEEFAAFLDKLKHKTAAANSRPRITFSFAVLFRSPQTPMQFAGRRMSEKDMLKTLERLLDLIKAAAFEGRISAGPQDAIFSELVAFADRRSTAVLVKSSVEHGYRYHGEISQKLVDYWRSQLKSRGLISLIDQSRNAQTVFPWDDIDTGINKDFLYKIWQELEAGRQISACISPPYGSGRCAGCQACETPEQIKTLNSLGPVSAGSSARKAALRLNTVRLLVKIPEIWAYCERDFIKAAVARHIMQKCPSATASWRRVDEILPEFFSSGLAVAAVTFAGDPAFVIDKEPCEDDISIIAETKPTARPAEQVFPMLLESVADADPAAVSREIDAILTGGRLKNLKQRQNGWLNWQINAGQAKKAGIEKISLNETDKTLRLTLIRMPELHLLNRLLNSRAPRIISLAPLTIEKKVG